MKATTAENIKAIKEFTKYLEYNYKEHTKTLKAGENYSDMENSLFFLEDYEKVSKKLVEVIEEYNRTH